MITTVLSVIVLHHPHIDATRNLIQQLKKQYSALVVVDNSPNSHQTELAELFSPEDAYYHFPQNIGLGAAHNVGIKRAMELNCNFVAIFDQDSTIPSELIEKLIRTFDEISQIDPTIAAVGPSYIDDRTNKKNKSNFVFRHTKKKMLISSGSLLSIATLKNIGLMDEDLFIDLIDTEWCHRAYKKGYSVYKSALATMAHRVGEVQPILGGRYQITCMNPFRCYYYARNVKRLMLQRRISFLVGCYALCIYIPRVLIKALFLPNTGMYYKNLIRGFLAK